MLKLCGETQDKLAQELIMFEVTIERDVVEPLYDLAEVTTPVTVATNRNVSVEDVFSVVRWNNM